MSTGWRLFWLGMLTAHGFAAAAWWWLMPGGFAISHLRFWVNEVLPWCVLGLAAGTRFVWWKRDKARDLSLASFAVFWIVTGIAARIVFPASAARLFLIPLSAGLLMAASLWRARACLKHLRALVLFLPIAMGIAMPLAQRAPAPDTRPWSSAPPIEETTRENVNPRTIILAPHVRIDPSEPVLTINRGRVTLGIQPRLTFISRSPDRCWTLLAPSDLRTGPPTRLVSVAQNQVHVVHMVHRDDNLSTLDARLDDNTLHIDAQTNLPQPIYSHLNTFTELTISGHRKLSVAFSPCAPQRVEFLPFQIRGDLPGRSAYLDADGNFKVVQARRAEKGPFTTLAQGKLPREQPLTMTLYDEDQPIFEVTLLDWAAQAGTQISPTAGHGLPVNAIEFSLDGNSMRSAAGMWITLAATSTGRGWDSVGHAAGTYRNRMIVRILGSQP